MSFDEAAMSLALGKKIARTGWDHEGAALSLLPEESVNTPDGATVHFPTRYVLTSGPREMQWDEADEDLNAWDWYEVN